MKELICTNCGVVGTPKNRVKGSFLVEVALWFFFIVPGIIYSIWRLSSKAKVCRSCGAENMVPTDSPTGRDLQDKKSNSNSSSKSVRASKEKACPFCAEMIKEGAIFCKHCKNDLSKTKDAEAETNNPEKEEVVVKLTEKQTEKVNELKKTLADEECVIMMKSGGTIMKMHKSNVKSNFIVLYPEN